MSDYLCSPRLPPPMGAYSFLSLAKDLLRICLTFLSAEKQILQQICPRFDSFHAVEILRSKTICDMVNQKCDDFYPVFLLFFGPSPDQALGREGVRYLCSYAGSRIWDVELLLPASRLKRPIPMDHRRRGRQADKCIPDKVPEKKRQFQSYRCKNGTEKIRGSYLVTWATCQSFAESQVNILPSLEQKSS